MRYDKRDTIIARKLKSKNLSDKLNEILTLVEIFVKFSGYYPKQLCLSYETFEEILNHRKDLITIFDEEYYILQLKIVL